MSALRYAFSLSKQELAEAEPPGTARLIEHDNHDHIHLVPTPSRSAADPLNWPRWRKYSVLALMALFSGVINFGSANIAPTLELLETQLPHVEPFTKLSHLVSVNVLLLGVSNILWVPLANTFGRRPIFILAMLIATLASVWCGLASSYDSLLGARALQGFGFGPADTLAATVLGEVFFVHERGRALAIYNFFLASGSFVGGISGGYIAGRLGYRYLFWTTAALLAGIFVGTVLLVPETSFDREAQILVEQDASRSHHDSTSDEKANVEMIERAMPTGPRGSFTFAQSLKVGVYRGHLLRNFIAPWRSLAFPGTCVVMLHYGGLVGGVVTISTIGPEILAEPPYLWGNNSGLLNLGGLIGALMGLILNFTIVDRILKRQAKKESHGLAEPEARLPVMFPGLFLATTGLWTFGFSAANPSPHAWVGLCVGFGMVGAGLTIVPGVGSNYLIDSYHSIAADCFVMNTIARAVVAFAWTFFVSTWIDNAGAALPFGIFGMLMGIFSLLTIPLWLYGKRLRIATAGRLPKED